MQGKVCKCRLEAIHFLMIKMTYVDEFKNALFCLSDCDYIFPKSTVQIN